MIYENLNLRTLKKIAKIYNVKKFSRLRKQELIYDIKKNKSALNIQRFYRRRLINNSLCPICLEKIKPNDPCYGYKTENNFIYYNLGCLIDNVLVSGDFRDPISRKIYTIDILKSIDNSAKSWKIKKKSLYSYWASPSEKNKRKKRKDHCEQMLILHRILDEINVNILNIIEGIVIGRTINNREYYLRRNVFPSFENYYEQYFVRDEDSAKHMLDNCMLKIQQVTSDNYSIRDYVLAFFHGLTK